MSYDEKKIRKFIDTKILPSGFIPSVLIFSLGAALFYVFINDKKTSGLPVLIVAGVCYILLGVGIYGIFRWVGTKILQLTVLFARLILRGNVELTITKEKVISRIYYK